MAEGWFYLGDEELFNNARTSAYIRNGLGPAGLAVQDCPCCDELAKDPLTFEVLDFESPLADPAPWYDSDVQASTEFLGFLVQVTGLDSTLARSITSKSTGRGGASLSRLVPRERNIVIHGHLISTSTAGQDWGMRWLTAKLARSLQCDACELEDALVLTSCPPSGAYEGYSTWTLRKVGVIDGPHYGDGVPLNHPFVRAFDLTLTSEHAYLYKDYGTCFGPAGFSLPAECVDFCTWLTARRYICCDITAPTVADEIAAKISVVAGAEKDVSYDITVTDASPCGGGSGTPSVRIPIHCQPAGSTLVIDGSTETITYTAPDGTVSDGFRFLELDPDIPFGWPTSGCDLASTCVCVEARVGGVGYDTLVTVQLIRRRL